jgi:hypothetical protein
MLKGLKPGGAAGSVFDLSLEKLDFVGGEIEERIDSVVQFRFGDVQATGEPGIVGLLLPQIGLPLIGSLWALHQVGGELEALLQGVPYGLSWRPGD